MRRILIGLALALAALPASAQTRDELWEHCEDDNPDLSIGGCTALIQSGQETTENLANAFYNRGLAYRQNGLYDQAISDYTQALRLTPNDPGTYNNRGFAYEKKGERDMAIADYRAALRIDPNRQSALGNLQRLGVAP